MILPQSLKRIVYRRILGWRIHPTATIGISYIDCDWLEMGPHTRIGHGNIIKGVGSFTMGANSSLGNLNHFFAHRDPHFPDRLFIIGENSLIMSRHFFDLAGAIMIGDHVTVAGRGSQFWSHGLVTDDEGIRTLTPKELVIGDDVYVGAGVIFAYCNIPDHCVVGAGAVTSSNFELRDSLIRGNPAKASPLHHARKSNLRTDVPRDRGTENADG